MRERYRVYHEWRFVPQKRRGLGIGLLLPGGIVAGKMPAGEELASVLNSDLYSIDLSAVATKYTDETARNLQHLLDAAEQEAVIVLLDEADALFGQAKHPRRR